MALPRPEDRRDISVPLARLDQDSSRAVVIITILALRVLDVRVNRVGDGFVCTFTSCSGRSSRPLAVMTHACHQIPKTRTDGRPVAPGRFAPPHIGGGGSSGIGGGCGSPNAASAADMAP
jgi:hypothetical protein